MGITIKQQTKSTAYRETANGVRKALINLNVSQIWTVYS